jgi:hypothetical protein
MALWERQMGEVQSRWRSQPAAALFVGWLLLLTCAGKGRWPTTAASASITLSCWSSSCAVRSQALACDHVFTQGEAVS